MRYPITPGLTLIASVAVLFACAAPTAWAQPTLIEQLEPRPVFASTQPAVSQPAVSRAAPPAPVVTSQPTSQAARSPSIDAAESAAITTTQPASTAASTSAQKIDDQSRIEASHSPVTPVAPVVSEEVLLDHLQTRFERIAQSLTPATAALRVMRAPMARVVSSSEPPGPVFGSAIVLSTDGLLLTCEHVVRGALTVDVTLGDGRQYRASVLGADARADVAVLRIRAVGLEPVSLSDAGRLRRGHLVFAAGYPAEISGSQEPAVTQGMVCATGRPLPVTLGAEEDRDYGDMIQFTAPVAGGFSGGPLADLKGHVVGMVTVNEDGQAGIFGYARPVGPRLRRLISRLSRGESIDYGYLGVAAGNLTEPLARQLGITRLEGAAIHLVEPGGAADRAGLVEDDVIVTLNGARIATADALVERAGDLPPGSSADVEYVRSGKRASVRLLVGRRQAPPGGGETTGLVEFRGATLAAADASLRQMANFPADAMVVTLVREGSPAGRAGLSPGDVVVRFQGAPATGKRVSSLALSGGDVLLGMATGGSVLVGSE